MTNTALGLRKSAAVALSAVGLATLGAAVAPAMASAATPTTTPTAAQEHAAHVQHLAHLSHLHVLHLEHLAAVSAHRAHVLHEEHVAQLAAQRAAAATHVSTVAAVTRTAGATSYSGMSPQQIAAQIVPADQLASFDQIISHESGWNVTATNPSSGAYGLCQALPGSKMASAGPDWQTNPATQIKWALNYMDSRYGSPNAAWSFWQAHNWY